LQKKECILYIEHKLRVHMNVISKKGTPPPRHVKYRKKNESDHDI